MVCDLNGEWDVFAEYYGEWSPGGSYPEMWKITQTGSSFVAVRMIDDPYNKKGSQVLQGVLDKGGIKKVMIFSAGGAMRATGRISDDGNKMLINDGEKARFKATRK